MEVIQNIEITQELIDTEVAKLKQQGYRGIEVDTDNATYLNIDCESKCLVCDKYHYDTPREIGSKWRVKDLECNLKILSSVAEVVNETEDD